MLRKQFEKQGAKKKKQGTLEGGRLIFASQLGLPRAAQSPAGIQEGLRKAASSDPFP